jgi:2-iminobutanoate/2-iminopropanoate deaminase
MRWKKNMSKFAINPEGLFQSRQYGFSQAVSASGTRTIYFSGQVAWDENQNIIGAGDLQAQTKQALSNLQLAVRSAGGDMPDIVSLRIYIRHDVMDQGRFVKDGLLEFFPSDDPPAATWIGVQSLADENFLIEIEAIAVLGDEE